MVNSGNQKLDSIERAAVADKQPNFPHVDFYGREKQSQTLIAPNRFHM